MTIKKPLRRAAGSLFHYSRGKRVDGSHDRLWGDCTGLWGDCTGLTGGCTGLTGDCTGLTGNLSEIPISQRPCDVSEWVQ